MATLPSAAARGDTANDHGSSGTRFVMAGNAVPNIVNEHVAARESDRGGADQRGRWA